MANFHMKLSEEIIRFSFNETTLKYLLLTCKIFPVALRFYVVVSKSNTVKIGAMPIQDASRRVFQSPVRTFGQSVVDDSVGHSVKKPLPVNRSLIRSFGP